MGQCLALVNGRVIDGLGGAPLPSGRVLVRDGRIAAVGPAAAVAVPPEATQIDVAGMTVLPALIDGHLHVTDMPGMLDHLGHVRSHLKGVGVLQSCLQWGTAVVGHAGGSVESVILRDTIRNGAIQGCADLLVGSVVTPTCGHVRGRSADGPWEVRKAVRAALAEGADWIKTCASGGFQFDHEKLTHEDYSLEELRALTDLAHAREKRVHVHAHAQPGLSNAIAAGCDVILHGVLIDERALEGIAAKNLWYMPTLHVTSEAFHGRPGLPAALRERIKRTSETHRAGVAKARAMGVRLAVGTDGWAGSVMNELAEWVGCGFTPMEAIVAATRGTAEALDILDATGTLEPGKRAHLFAVAGDPLTDIRCLASAEALGLVMKDGAIVRNLLRDINT